MTVEQLMCYNVEPQTPVIRDGGDWRPLYSYPELMEALANKNHNGGYVSSMQDNRKLLFGLFALFLGTLGVQYFYIGKTNAGIYTILLSLVTCSLWGIVTFIQGIMVLCMSNSEFEAKYINTPRNFPIF